MLTSLSPESYQALLKRLLPRGVLWEQIGTRLEALLLAFGDELDRLHDRLLQLLEEADPRTATETIDAWERLLGLPSACVYPWPTVLAERQALVHAALVSSGGQSAAYFIDLASTVFGLTVTIFDPRPFEVGRSVAGDAVYGWEDERFCAGAACGLGHAGDPLVKFGWSYTWIANVAGTPTLSYFRAGAGAAGDPLVEWANVALECLFRSHAPAHTIVLFTYGP